MSQTNVLKPCKEMSLVEVATELSQSECSSSDPDERTLRENSLIIRLEKEPLNEETVRDFLYMYAINRIGFDLLIYHKVFLKKIENLKGMRRHCVFKIIENNITCKQENSCRKRNKHTRVYLKEAIQKALKSHPIE